MCWSEWGKCEVTPAAVRNPNTLTHQLLRDLCYITLTQINDRSWGYWITAAGVPTFYWNITQVRDKCMPTLHKKELRKCQVQYPLCCLILQVLENHLLEFLLTDSPEGFRLWDQLQLSDRLICWRAPISSTERHSINSPEKHRGTVLMALLNEHGHQVQEKPLHSSRIGSTGLKLKTTVNPVYTDYRGRIYTPKLTQWASSGWDLFPLHMGVLLHLYTLTNGWYQAGLWSCEDQH